MLSSEARHQCVYLDQGERHHLGVISPSVQRVLHHGEVVHAGCVALLRFREQAVNDRLIIQPRVRLEHTGATSV
jgi:hypothetical protein